MLGITVPAERAHRKWARPMVIAREHSMPRASLRASPTSESLGGWRRSSSARTPQSGRAQEFPLGIPVRQLRVSKRSTHVPRCLDCSRLLRARGVAHRVTHAQLPRDSPCTLHHSRSECVSTAQLLLLLLPTTSYTPDKQPPPPPAPRPPPPHSMTTMTRDVESR